MKILPLIFAFISALAPYITQKTGLSKKYGFPLKMLCVLLYLITGVFSALLLYRVTAYSVMILGGLALGAFGDFFLEYKKKKFFPLGMVFFALGHIAYIITFLSIGEDKAVYYLLPVLGVTVIQYLPLLLIIRKLKFKKFKEMILLYSAVLVFFFSCTLVMGTSCMKEGNLSFGLCIIIGGTLFFASDLMIGMGKGGIERPAFLHNAVSYTYFAAQTLLALSIYFQ